MNKKYLPALVCGFGAAVVSTVPAAKGLDCCLFIPLAAGISVALYKKTFQNEFVERNTALLNGFLTGIFAAIFATFFYIVLTYITHTNEFVEAIPESEKLFEEIGNNEIFKEAIAMLKQEGEKIKTSGFSFFYTIAIFVSNIIIYSIFGMIGGLFGLMYLNRKTR